MEIELDKGDWFRLRLDWTRAPLTCTNFVERAASGLYEDCAVFRADGSTIGVGTAHGTNLIELENQLTLESSALPSTPDHLGRVYANVGSEGMISDSILVIVQFSSADRGFLAWPVFAEVAAGRNVLTQIRVGDTIKAIHVGKRRERADVSEVLRRIDAQTWQLAGFIAATANNVWRPHDAVRGYIALARRRAKRLHALREHVPSSTAPVIEAARQFVEGFADQIASITSLDAANALQWKDLQTLESLLRPLYGKYVREFHKVSPDVRSAGDAWLKRASSPEAGAGGPLLTGTSFKVVESSECPTFEDVGGMDVLKRQLRDSVGLLLARPDEAKALGVSFNGVLLHGPPGTGKTFFARACAGEFGCSFMSVGTADLLSAFVGDSPRLVAAAFEAARAVAPVVLFFDEFDAVARRRGDVPAGPDRQVLEQLLRNLEGVRDRPDVVVMAATNSLDDLDPAVVRPGRFDVKVRVDMPDEAARRAIFEAQLSGRATAPDISLDELARRSDGLSAAGIAGVVNRAALKVLAEGGPKLITHHGLLEAITEPGGKDRPLAAEWSWDQLVLDERTKRELMELCKLIERPEIAKQLGIAPPRGALLYGPPGTGKTTIAKVLAAQARTSFYEVSGADVMSKWMGESAQNIAHLFDRARENRPSIIFFDEIDAVAGRRDTGFGDGASHEAARVVNQLLQEIDGMGSTPGVFVLGATNRPDMLDPALLRGGRLSRKVEIPLPDAGHRLELLRLSTRKMSLGADVSLEEIAGLTEGRSGADLVALCEQAGLNALLRWTSDAAAEVSRVDFMNALQP